MKAWLLIGGLLALGACGAEDRSGVGGVGGRGATGGGGAAAGAPGGGGASGVGGALGGASGNGAVGGVAGGIGGAAGSGGGAAGSGSGSGVAGSGGGAAGSGSGVAGAAGIAGTSGRRCQGAWTRDIQTGTTADDQILGMAVDADDDIIVSGYEQGVVGVTNIEPDGNARAIVAKYSPSGTMLWKTTLDTAATETAEDVAIDPSNGGLVVLGRTSGAFPSFVNQGQFDLILALLDPTSGQPSTIFQTGNERPQHPARLSLAPGGQVVVGGWDDTYILTNYVAANQDGFFASFSIDPGPAHAINQTSWLYTYPPAATAPFSNANGVAAEQDGSGASYIVTTVSASPSVSGIFVTKLRDDHTTAWTERISASPFDAVTAVALSPSGELYVTGGTFLTLGAKSFGQEDAFVMKLDKETGAPLWTGQGGGADSDYPTALAFDTLGNVAVAGYTLGSVVDSGANQGGADIFALKWSSGGDLVSAWQKGTSADDLVTSMAADHCGNFFVGGFTSGALVAGQANAGGEDMFVLRVDF